jgi:hypothetical protein
VRVRDARLRDLGAGRQVQPEHRRAQRQQHRHGQGRFRGHEQGDESIVRSPPLFPIRIRIDLGLSDHHDRKAIKSTKPSQICTLYQLINFYRSTL